MSPHSFLPAEKVKCFPLWSLHDASFFRSRLETQQAICNPTQADCPRVIPFSLRVYRSHFWLLHKKFEVSKSSHLSSAAMFICQIYRRLLCLPVDHNFTPYVFSTFRNFLDKMSLLESKANELFSIFELRKNIKVSPLEMRLGFMCVCVCLSGGVCAWGFELEWKTILLTEGYYAVPSGNSQLSLQLLSFYFLSLFWACRAGASLRHNGSFQPTTMR